MAISVVMSVYNGGAFLTEAVESVLAQSFRHFEFVIVDDGSTDGSTKVLRSYAQRDKRITLIEQSNTGLPIALNLGIERARYDLIARMDADDVMVPSRLERQLAFMTEHPEVAVACSFIRLIDRNGRVIGRSEPNLPDADLVRVAPHRFLAFSHSSAILRKRAWSAVGGYRQEYFLAEDQDLWARMLKVGFIIAVQREHLMRHRIHSSSISIVNLRRQCELCDLVELNLQNWIVGRPELDIPEYEQRLHRASLWTRARLEREFFWQYNYKRATRAYAEGEWYIFARTLGCAMLTAPVRTLMRISSRR